jgi:hypothetical protein
MPVFNKKKNRSNIHQTRLTSSRQGDEQGLTVPRDNKGRDKAKNIPAGTKEAFNAGKNA